MYIPMFLSIGMFCSCENDINKIVDMEQLENLPDQQGKNVEILYSKNAEVEFKLFAPILNRYEGLEPYNEMPEGVELQIFDSLGRVSTSLTSNYAIDRTHENIMEARENVVVINAKGEQLNTEKLVWNQKTKLITSDVFVKITTEDEIIMGDGLESNQDFSRYRILKPRGIVNIEE